MRRLTKGRRHGYNLRAYTNAPEYEAVLDGVLAVPYIPATRLSRIDAFQRPCRLATRRWQVALKVGSHTIGVREPGQVREEAALSGLSYVLWGLPGWSRLAASVA